MHILMTSICRLIVEALTSDVKNLEDDVKALSKQMKNADKTVRAQFDEFVKVTTN